MTISVEISRSQPVSFIAERMGLGMHKGTVAIAFEEAHATIHIARREVHVAVTVKVPGR
jgi:hypothetical protein